MTSATIRQRLRELLDADALQAADVGEDRIDELASHLLWRVGRVAEDAPVTVRVGFASSAPLFEQLPRLRSASDADVEEAVADGSLRVEWVGYGPE